MIKLKDLIKEIEEEDLGDLENDREARLQAIRNRLANTTPQAGSLLSFTDDELKQGFKTGPKGEIIYTPNLTNMKTQLVKYKKDIRPYTYDSDERIANLSSALYKAFGKLDGALSKLRDLIELKKRNM
jgi:hypothetical protein